MGLIERLIAFFTNKMPPDANYEADRNFIESFEPKVSSEVEEKVNPNFIPENRLPKDLEMMPVILINCGYHYGYKKYMILQRQWQQKYVI